MPYRARTATLVLPALLGCAVPAPGAPPDRPAVEVRYDTDLTTQQNGDRLERVLESLKAGDRVVIREGTYTVNGRLAVRAPGTEEAPIVIEGEGAVVITRDDEKQNVLNIEGGWFTLRGLEIRGGSRGLVIGAAHHVLVTQCEIHGTADAAVTANSADTSHLSFVGNHVHHTRGCGEGFYLGGNAGKVVTHHTRVVGNRVHDTGGEQGDGIELKPGSWACEISDNVVERTRYPGILVYGNGGRPERNVVERNIVVGSAEAGIQVAADAIVRNNLVIGARDACIASQPHQGATPRALTIVHNTLVAEGTCFRARAWTGDGLVFANNALFSRAGRPCDGIGPEGNVIVEDLSAFVKLAMDGSVRDATPREGSPLVGGADPAHAVADDLTGAARTGTLEAGAVDLR
ncbi:MAG: right-handed parallel beta-helix repeat-containing protein [Planctomycetes bacterium]|nr:right-handed parallel beta-helix repeat-containing protein [Planctomycetota bacterium]